MKTALIYTGKVGCNAARHLPADYIGEKVPYNAIARRTPVTPTFDRPTAHAVAKRNAAALVRYRNTAAVLDDLANKAAHSVCRALIAKSGLTKNPVRRPTWTGKLSPVAANITNIGHDETWTIQQIRWDLMSHNGTDKAAGYWDRVDTFATAAKRAEQREQSVLNAAKHYKTAAAAAKRAGNMRVYDAMMAHVNEWLNAAQAAHKAAAAANYSVWTLVNDYAVGKGVDLYQIAALYLWERLAVDGLTVNSLVRGKASNGRTSVKTVFQWACIMCRRAVRDESRMNDQTAAGYTYFTVAAENENRTEEVRRAPRLYDVENMGGGDGLTTAERLEKLGDLIEKLELSPVQRQIIAYRLKGYSRNDIASKLGIARGTLNKQLLRMSEKVQKSGVFTPEMLEKYLVK